MRRLLGLVALVTVVVVAGCSSDSKPKVVKNPTLLINAGIAAEKQGDYQGAAALFQHALRLDPNNYYAHFDLGTIYQHDAKYAAALAEYGASFAANPSFTSALYNEGTIYQITNPTLAVPTFQHVVAINPTNAAAYVDLGTVELQLGMKAAARRDLLKGLTLLPALRSALPPADITFLGPAASSTTRPSATPSASPSH